MAIQILRGNSNLDETILKSGQLAYNTNTNTLKVGDGTSKFSSLPDLIVPSSEIESGT